MLHSSCYCTPYYVCHVVTSAYQAFLYYMISLKKLGSFLFYLSFLLLEWGCGNAEKPPEKDVVIDPAKLGERVSDNLKLLIDYSSDNGGKINDSVVLKYLPQIRRIYEDNNYSSVWSSEENWNEIADSLYNFLDSVKQYGLFPSDYHISFLIDTRKMIARDSASRQDAALWSRADVLLTEAYLRIASDLRIGRLERDSTTLRNDSLLTPEYFLSCLNKAVASRRIKESLHSLEPSSPAYTILKAGIKRFLDADTVPDAPHDSLMEKFKRIAVTLDRYKQLPDTMPPAYAWVNIPAFSLYVYDADTLVVESKVIVGAPATRTPLLASTITNFITYPQWTVPYSIIFKEMLPGIKNDVNYLQKKNLMVVDRYDSVVDPATINWNKMSKTHFPYLLRQRQGDDNSLGVLKFNFRNKYSVYLHDTNARSLFSRTNRALSHGCVRVEKWKDLSHFLIRNDTARFNVDTLGAWISRAEKHVVSGFKGLPVYIRYFTVEGKEDGKLKFYKDIYKEDSVLSARYFAGKK